MVRFSKDFLAIATICNYIYVFVTAASGTSAELRKVTVPGITTAECAAVYGSIISDDILCVDTTGGKGSCNVRHSINLNIYVLIF
jgi:hypothetical protein